MPGPLLRPGQSLGFGSESGSQGERSLVLGDRIRLTAHFFVNLPQQIMGTEGRGVLNHSTGIEVVSQVLCSRSQVSTRLKQLAGRVVVNLGVFVGLGDGLRD